MAVVTTYRAYETTLPLVVGGVSTVFWDQSLPADTAAGGDSIACFDLPAGARVTAGSLCVEGTLGPSCTATLMLGDTALTGATTAGGADTARMTAHPPAAASAARTVRIAIGGADMATPADVRVMIQYVMSP
ncbi:hypothetical protein [Roseospira visakhapatnamensis]|uniref:Uncharacterized protein n=1 Tax=Roseospira visakhapatnamensis TaxID=390880 RepID=A0A7W6RD03_9PROT|nr:hypothetical protein [Roseospira visakhapatnamensis]MBB4266304.1 hypothetical protein [Roseospira visakhapatnamensis]